MKLKHTLLLISIGSILLACGAKPGASSNASLSDSVIQSSNNLYSSSLDSSNDSVNSNNPSSQTSNSVNDSKSNPTSSNKSNSTPTSTSISKGSSSYSNKVTITVTNGTGSGEYKVGDLVKVDCDIPNGYVFDSWKEGNNVLSKTKQYSFIASRNLTITAHFTSISQGFSDVRSLQNYLTSIESNIQSRTIRQEYEIKDNKVTNEYKEKQDAANITYFSNGRMVDGLEKDEYSLLPQNVERLEIHTISNNKYYNICKYTPSSTNYTSYATKQDVVNNVTNGDKEISSTAVKNKVHNSIVSELNDLLTEKFSVAVDSFKQTDKQEGKKEIELISHKIEGNFYIQNGISFVLDKNANLIDSVEITEKHFVRATMVDENEQLIEGATAKNDYKKTSTFKYGTQLEFSSDIDLSSYFISSFDVKAQYYDKNTLRYFNKDFKYLPMDATISIYQFDIVKESVLPETACEILKIANVLSSNPDVAIYEKSSIKTLSAGKTNLTFVTTQGATCTYEVEVKPLAPKNIIINSENTVEVNKRIELTATIEPDTASSEIIWSVADTSIATITQENGHVYLNGISQGNAVVRATSKEDETKYVEKTIVVTRGELSPSEVTDLMVGTWRSKYEYVGGPDKLVLTFNNDGTFVLEDVFRGDKVKLSGTGNYEVVNASDSTASHVGTYYTTKNSDYYLVKVTNYTLTGSNAGSYFVELHFVVKKDGSKIYMHSQNSDTLSTLKNGSTSEFAFDKD